MPKIFISYRRDDSNDAAHRIYDRLVKAFGRRNVFIDVDNIKLGSNFMAEIEEFLITNCDVMLVIIGEDWLHSTDDEGNQRLFNRVDFVRHEVEIGIRHSRKIHMIPVVLNDTNMPSENELPPSIAVMAGINAAFVHRDRFESDVERLIKKIRSDTTTPRQASSFLPWVIAAVAVLALVGVLLSSVLGGGGDDPTNTPDSAAQRDPATHTVTATELISEVGVTGAETEAVQVEPPTATETNTASHTPSDTPTDTLQPSETPTHTPTETIQPSETPSPINTPIDFEAMTIAELEDYARTAVEDNDAWEPIIRDFEGVDMALVPVGCFEMGSEDAEDDEQPVATICIEEPFWIDVTEVTNMAFGGAVTSSYCQERSSEDDQPRICVNWYDAKAHCDERGGRLPTEAEWEFAARGPNNLVYPWGNDYDAGVVIGYDDPTYGSTSTAPVGSRPEGASWVGALDMAGNVWEWVSTIYDSYDDNNERMGEFSYPYDPSDGREDSNRANIPRGLRGGSWVNTAVPLRASDRNRSYPVDSYDMLGFRCARSVETGVASSDEPSGFSTDSATIAELEDYARTAVEDNDAWEPIIRDFGGVEMALVPVGCFEMGSENGYDDEQPVSTICTEEPFWMDVTEVTNVAYGGARTDSSYCLERSSEDDQPRVCVTWYDAKAHCEERGGRLPTEAEWEFAARGPNSLVYPWGNAYDAAVVIGGDDPTYGGVMTAPVGSRPAGASWVGALDMSGNVWEWVSTIYDNDEFSGAFLYPYNPSDGREDANRTNVWRVLRGGSFADAATDLRSGDRLGGDPGYELSNVGFRCARS